MAFVVEESLSLQNIQYQPRPYLKGKVLIEDNEEYESADMIGLLVFT